jgi:DNA mismatch repair protein MutS
VRNFNVAVKEWDDQVVFLHQIVPGAADKSYGIHVAQLAGVPHSVNDRAREVLAWLEAQHDSLDTAACGLANPHNTSRPSPNGQWQLSLFGAQEHPRLEEIRAANLDAMRPLEALELLHVWPQRLITETSPAQ